MTHITEQIETYLTGGLSPEERKDFQVHLATCDECAAALADGRAAEAAMNELFAADRPSADFEDRMIHALALPHPWLTRPIIHPMVRRAAIGIAASLLVAGIGYAVNGGLNNGSLPGISFLDGRQPVPKPGRTQVFHSTSTRLMSDPNSALMGDTVVSEGTAADQTAHGATVRELKRSAVNLMKQSRYDDALGVVDTIRQLDPNDEYALGVQPVLQDKRNAQTRGAGGLSQATAGDSNGDTLRYPTQWSDNAAIAYRGDLPVTKSRLNDSDPAAAGRFVTKSDVKDSEPAAPATPAADGTTTLSSAARGDANGTNRGDLGTWQLQTGVNGPSDAKGKPVQRGTTVTNGTLAWAGDDGGHVYTPPRSKDANILISRGYDGIYGTADDVTIDSNKAGDGAKAKAGGNDGKPPANGLAAGYLPADSVDSYALATDAPDFSLSTTDGEKAAKLNESQKQLGGRRYYFSAHNPAGEIAANTGGVQAGGIGGGQGGGGGRGPVSTSDLVLGLQGGLSAPQGTPAPASTPANQPPVAFSGPTLGNGTTNFGTPPAGTQSGREPAAAGNTGVNVTLSDIAGKPVADGKISEIKGVQDQSAPATEKTPPVAVVVRDGATPPDSAPPVEKPASGKAEVASAFDPSTFSNLKYEHQDAPSAGQVTQNPSDGPAKPQTGAGTANDLVKSGQAALAAGNTDEARQKMADAVHADPSNAVAQHTLDQILTEQGRNPNGPAVLESTRAEIDTRRQEITYREEAALKEAKEAIANNKLDRAEAAIQRADLAANADRPVFTPEDLRKFDKDLDGARLTLLQQEELNKKGSDTNAVGIEQVRIERERAILERQHTVRDLQKIADDLIKQGKTKEAEAVVAQIKQLDPNHPEPAKPEPVNPANPAIPVAPPVQPARVAPAHVDAPAVIRPRIIRTGDLDFEVESFEVAVSTITKVVEEEGGYVSTTNSDKLPNGKVKGTVVLRVTPERLDTLVLKLRGIGDLKTQNIRAQDITKQYTDLESRLRAAQIMCDQILEIIKSGKAQVKDLLEAEKQLGVYREKVEQLTGEINYYANQVSLSTLTLTLFEKDIRTPALASESETVTMTMVTERVDEAAIKAKEAIAAAKGRIIASQQAQTDEGQSTATIKAQVPPDAAEEVIAKLKQIEGKLDHFDRQRSQTTSNGNAPVDARIVDPVKVKREDVTIDLTLYNLAKLTPRRTTQLSLAAADVDEAKRALEEQVRTAGGRIIDARTEYPRPDQKKGTITFDAPTEKAEALVTALKGLGETLQISTVENANGPGVTESKRGFSATIFDMAGVIPRRQTTLMLVTPTVDQTQVALADQIKAAGGRVIARRIEHPTPEQTTGILAFELPAAKAETFVLGLKPAGEVLQVNTTDNNSAQNVTDSKRGFQITLLDLAGVMPRRVTTLALAATGVDTTQQTLAEQVRKAGGRVISQRIEHPAPEQSVGFLDFELPPDKADAFLLTIKQAGETIQANTTDNSGAQIITDAKRGFQLKILGMASVMPRRVTTLTLVTNTVDAAEAALVEQVRTAGGRVISRKLEHPAADQSVGTLNFEVPSDKAEAIVLSLKQQGDAMQISTADNAGTVLTDSKRGFGITLRSLTTFKAREDEQVTLASANVRDAFNDLRGMIHTNAGRVLTEHLNEADAANTVGQLEFEVSRDAISGIEAQMAKDGQVVSRRADRSTAEDTIDTKVYVRLTIASAEQLPARQSSVLSLEVGDVQRSMDDLAAAALNAGGRQVDNPGISQSPNGQTTATVQYDVPLNQIQAMIDKADAMGTRKSRQTSIDTHAPEGKLARARLTVTFETQAALSGPDDSLWSGVRQGLVTSLKVLSYSMRLIMVGLCVVVPFGFVLWAAWRLVKWTRKNPQPAGTVTGVP